MSDSQYGLSKCYKLFALLMCFLNGLTHFPNTGIGTVQTCSEEAT